MNIQYYEDTDTLHIVFRPQSPVETRDLDEHVLIDVAEDGRICSLTIEHASQHLDSPEVHFERIRAQPAG